MAPKAKNFANAYAQTVDDIDTATLDNSLRSYMDSGEDFFEGETFKENGEVRTRNQIITRVRENIRKRMLQENAASAESANQEKVKHGAYTAKIVRLLGEAEEIRRDKRKNEAESMVLSGTNYAQNRGAALDYLNNLIRNEEANVAAEERMLHPEEQQDEALISVEDEDNSEDNSDVADDEDLANQTIIAEEVDQDDNEGAANQEEADMVSEDSLGKRRSDLQYLITLRNQLQNADPRGKSKLKRFFTFVSFRGSRKDSKNLKLNEKYEAKRRKISENMEKWTRERQDYADKVFRKHYANFDAMAKSWYEMTQEYSVGPDGEIPDEIMQNRSVPEKAIVEYTGVFDNGGVENLLDRIRDNPYLDIKPEQIPLMEYKNTNAGSANVVDRENHTKTHTRFVMYSQSDGEGLKTRYKFSGNLMGRRSKKQFTSNDPTALQKVQNVEPGFFDQIYAGRANLESDELDINGRKLRSEKSAEVLHARLKKNGHTQTVHGFLLNGEFYTDEEVAEGEKVSGRKDMKYFGRRDFSKQEKAERLREAIRKSAFFQHVNAATIQHYSSYNADDDYLEDVNNAIEKKWEKEANREGGRTKEAIINEIKNDPKKLKRVPRDLWGAAVFEYIKGRIDEPGEEPFPSGNPLSDPLVKYVCDADDQKGVLTIMTLLLAEDGAPTLWTIARKMVVDSSWVVANRTKSKLKYLPESGQMMRMALLEELVNHQSTFSEFDADQVLGFINIPGLSVAQEELDNKRGLGAWFKRNLLNGNILKEAVSIASLGFKVADLSSDINNKRKDSEWELDDDVKDKRDERECWFLYGECMAEASNMGRLLGGGAVLLGHLKGGSEGAGKARDVGFQVADALGMIGDLKVVFSPIWKAIKKFYKKFIKKQEPQEEEGDEEEKGAALKSLDLPVLRSILKWLTSLLNLADGIRDIASYHMDTNDEAGKWKDWGNLVAWKGPLQWVFDTARNLINVVNDIAEIIVTTRRIHRIDKTDTALETAINAYTSHQEEEIEEAEQENQENEAEEQQEAQEQDDEAAKERKLRELGKAATDNSQAQYFMALTKAQSRKSRSAAGWNILSSSLTMARDTVKQFAKSGELITMATTLALTIAPKVVDFISWTIGKLKYDRGNFKNNIAAMLGSKDYAGTPYFDKVLSRETGIVSSDYLVDLARIFMAVDTHALFQKEDKTAGEEELAIKTASTLYGNVDKNNVKKIELDRMLSYAGFSGDSDWRALLRNSIKK